MIKNKAGQKLTVFAFDATTNLAKSGDAANLSAFVSIDDAAPAAITGSAAEQSATLAAGFYLFDLPQAQTNGDKLAFSAKSGTANVQVIALPPVVYTGPDNFSLLSISAGGALTLTADERAAVATALLDLANGIENGFTPRQVMRLIAAVLLGKSSASGDTFRDLNDTKNRVSASVDSSDNRTSITYDAT